MAIPNQSTYSWFPRADGRMERRTQSGRDGASGSGLGVSPFENMLAAERPRPSGAWAGPPSGARMGFRVATRLTRGAFEFLKHLGPATRLGDTGERLR